MSQLFRRLKQFGDDWVSVQHCYRQGNTVADALAAMGSDGTVTMFQSFVQLSRHIRGLCSMDRLHIPSFRFTKSLVL